MIIDSSAIIALARREPRYEELLAKLTRATRRGVGSPTLVEAGLVLRARLGTDPTGFIDRLLRDFDIEVIPLGEPHWREALSAYARFGKGLHPAALNYGDCMSYAVARLSDEPLLCVGNDFAKTDLVLATAT